MLSFLFGKKDPETPGKEYALNEVPLLGLLNAADLKFVEDKVRLAEYKKGDAVYRQGQAPDAFYMILTGRLRVMIPAGDAEAKSVTYLYRGDYFGEISLLTEKPHSVTVEAMNDSLILILGKEDFNDLLRRAPHLSLHLSRRISLQFRNEAEREIVETKIVSVVGGFSDADELAFSVEMALRLTQETKRGVFFLDGTTYGKGCRQLLGSGVDFQPLNLDTAETLKDSDIAKLIKETPSGVKVLQVSGNVVGGGYEKKPIALLSYLITQAEFIIIELESQLTELILKFLSQSDHVFLMVRQDDGTILKNREILRNLKELFGFPANNIRVVLTENHVTAREVERKLDHEFCSILPRRTSDDKKEIPCLFRESQSRYSRAIRYLAREVAGNLVGLVLGSGAAYGLAHVGVIKVIEEAKIPVDIVVGSSIGSVIGALWASGYSGKEIEAVTMSLSGKNGVSQLFHISDLAPIYRGFVKGHRVVRFLRGLLGKKTFRDMKIPLKIVATDLLTSERVVFEEGDVVRAVRASIAIPGIFQCGHVNGKVLIDGGVADPLPVKLLADMGVRKIIAVNVLPGPEQILERKRVSDKKREMMKKRVERAGFLARWGHSINRVFRHRVRENIFNVLMSTIQYMGYTIASHSTRDANIVIHPILATGHWAEFYSPAKFIRIGEEKAREQLAEILKLVEPPKR